MTPSGSAALLVRGRGGRGAIEGRNGLGQTHAVAVLPTPGPIHPGRGRAASAAFTRWPGWGRALGFRWAPARLRSAPALVVWGAGQRPSVSLRPRPAPPILVEQWNPNWPWFRVATEAWLLKCASSPASLFTAVGGVEALLVAGDLPAAQGPDAGHNHLVSRETANLGPGEVASAAVESLAENLTDSVVAPLFFFLVGGLPAVWARFRAVNTADAMIGYRTGDLEDPRG